SDDSKPGPNECALEWPREEHKCAPWPRLIGAIEAADRCVYVAIEPWLGFPKRYLITPPLLEGYASGLANIFCIEINFGACLSGRELTKRRTIPTNQTSRILEVEEQMACKSETSVQENECKEGRSNLSFERSVYCSVRRTRP